MAIVVALTEEERYLLAILDSPDGLDLAEFSWYDPESPDDCYRAWDFHWSWYRCEDMYQVDQGARATGKTVGITMRATAFPFNYEGQKMLVTAPELNHLRPLTDAIEARLLSTRMLRELLPDGKGNGMNRQPHWQCRFKNGSVIVSRLPNKDGKGVKGMHVIQIELDEAQDYPLAGWIEIMPTLNAGLPGAAFRCHGVSKGVRDKFFEKTEALSGWTVHRPMAMNRPTWSTLERTNNIREYGGSRQNIDYKRNIYGEHGDASNSVFVLSRLMACVDTDDTSEYNTEIYHSVKIEYERFPVGASESDRLAIIEQWLDFPGQHLHGYTQKVGQKEVGSPRGYSAYYAGMDVGVTNHPSEILVFGQRIGTDFLELLTRIQMHRINTDDQKVVIARCLQFYGERMKAFSLDKMQPVSEPVLTPSGWRPIGELQVGDQVIGSDGAPTDVIGVYPQTDRRVMRVTCTDGSWTRCGPEHLWTVKHTQHRDSMVLTTEQLAEKVNRPGARQWTIPMLSGPAQTQSAPLPIDPYVLGALLGDGNLRSHSIRFSNPDAEVVAEVQSRVPVGYLLKRSAGCDFHLVNVAHEGRRRQRDARGCFVSDNDLLNELRMLGLTGKLAHQKFIPGRYLQASVQERLLLLQGLMDTDGWVSVTKNSSHIGIRLSSEQMIKDIVSLVESLGGSAHYREHATSCNGKPGRTAYRATLMLPPGVVPFRLSRKADAMIPRTRKPNRRYIASIEPDGEEDSVCIRVAADDELYVTRHHLLTHNTGVGFPIWDQLSRDPRFGRRIYGFNFSEKRVVGFEDRPLERTETMADVAILRNVVEASTDWLRNDYVDNKNLRLPYDREVLLEFQGQTYSVIKDSGNPYGTRRLFAGGSFHTLDAAKMAIAGIIIPPLEEQMAMQATNAPVLDMFVGGY